MQSIEIKDWYNKIFSNQELWLKHEELEKFPSPIAYEYNRLRDMFGKHEGYGALLQMKDMFELLLKLPVLILAAYLFQKRDALEVEESRLLVSMLDSQISLGNWEVIAKTTVSVNKKVGPQSIVERHLPELKPILYKISELFKNNKIANWRNENIGHGALVYMEDEDTKNEIEKKINLITQYLREVDNHYKSVEITIAEKNFSEKSFILKGHCCARNLPVKNARLNIALGEKLYPLHPYIQIIDGGIYFFDSHNFHVPTSHLLSYPDGQKIKQNIDELEGFLRSAKPEIKYQGGIIKDGIFNLDEERIIEQITNIKDYVKQHYLREWLEKTIEEHDRGVFLLRMDRGTGKSTFCRSIDPFALDELKIADTDVRVYYINSVYGHHLRGFANRLHEILCSRLSEKGYPVKCVGGNTMPLSFSVGKDPKKEMVEFLNFYCENQEVRSSVLTEKKFLIVIDGLDEIPLGENLTIFDTIPEPEMLPENVYILLTCRTDGEISEFTRKRLKNLKTTEIVVFDRNGADNKNIAQIYVENKIYVKLKDNLKDFTDKERDELKKELLQKAEYRLLYLRALSELMQFGLLRCDIIEQPVGELIKNMPDGENLIPYFLLTLKRMYGEKYFNRVLSLFIIISSAYEPLTINEIAYLMENAGVDMRLLANMADLRCFLLIERDVRGNLISIANNGLQNYINIEYIDAIKVVSAKQATRTIKLIESAQISFNEDGATYLMAWLPKIAKRAEEEFKELLIEFQIAVKLHKAANSRLESQNQSYILNRQVMIYKHSIEIYEKLEDIGRLPESNNLAMAYIRRGNSLNFLNRLEEALNDYLQAEEIMKKLILHGDMSCQDDLATVFMNSGVVLNNLSRPEEALFKYQQCEDIIEKLLQNKKLDDHNNLATIYMNHGVALMELNRVEDAEIKLSRCIEIREKIIKHGQPLEQRDMAMAYINHGTVLYRLNCLEKALVELKRGIEIIEKLEKQDGKLDLNDLAWGYINNGLVLKKLNRPEEALNEFKQCKEIREKLHEQGKLHDINDMAKAYFYHGMILTDLNHHKEALIEFERCIEIREKLLSQGRLHDINDLAWVYMNRGVALSRMDHYEESLSNYNRSIEIREKLNEHEKLHDICDLALDYYNRADVLISLERPEEALHDFNRCIKIIERLNKQCKLYNFELLSAYFYSGMLLKNLGRPEKALHDYRKFIAIQEELIKKGNSCHINALREACLECYIILSSMGRQMESLDYYKKSILMLEKLMEQGVLNDINALAKAYLSYSELIWQTKSYNEGLDYAIKALKLRDEVIMQNPHIASDYFETFYFIFSELYHFPSELIRLFNERRKQFTTVISNDANVKILVEKCIDELGNKINE